MIYTYPDPYLSRLVEPEHETRAIADVQLVRADFPSAWQERLVRLRAYIIVCQESQRSAEDLFSIKLGQYQREYDKTLPLAVAAADSAGGVAGAGLIFSVELIRS